MGEKETQVKDYGAIGSREVTPEANKHKREHGVKTLVLMLGEKRVRPGQSPGVSRTQNQ